MEQAAPGRYIPAELARISLRALSPQPEDRYSDINQLIEEVRLYLSGASSRSAADATVAEVRSQLDSMERALASSSGISPQALYAQCAECLAGLNRAAGMWARQPDVPRLRKRVLDLYTQTAIQQGDLMLARGLTALMEPGLQRNQCLDIVAGKEALTQRKESQRKWLMASLVLLLALHGIGITLYLSTQIQTSQRLAVERDTADRARNAAAKLQSQAEQDNYLSNIAAAAFSYDLLRADKTARLLLEDTPPALRNWEWGALAHRVFGDCFNMVAADFVAGGIWSPDGGRVYSGSRNGAVHFWSGKTGRYEGSWKYFTGRLYDIKPSPDGKNLLLTSFDRISLIVDAETGKVRQRLKGHQGLIFGGAWSSCGRFVLTGSQDKTAILWNAANSAPIRSYDGFEQSVNGVSFGQGDQTVLLYSADGQARIVDRETGAILAKLSGPGPEINDGRYNPDFSQVAIAGADRKVRIFSASNGAPLAEHEFRDSAVFNLTYIPGTPYLACILDNGDAYIFEWKSGAIAKRFQVQDGSARNLRISPDGRFLTVAGRFTIQHLLLSALIPKSEKLPPEPWLSKRQNADAYIPVFGLTLGRDPNWNRLERVWNTTEGLTVIRQNGRVILAESRYATISPDGSWKFLIDPETLSGQAVDSKTGKVLYKPSSTRLSQATVSPDGRYLAVVNPLDKIHIVDTATWTERTVLSVTDPKNPPKGLSRYVVGDLNFSKDSSRLAVSYLNDRFVVFDTRDFRPLYESIPVIGVGPCIVFNPNGRTIVTGGNDDRVIIWDADTGQMIRSLQGNRRPISEATFNADGSRLITLARDRTVRLWDPNSGKELMTLTKSPDGHQPVGAQFTQDGQAVAVLISDGTVQVFESIPWNEAEYAPSGKEHLRLATRIELRNRRKLFGPHITADDITHVPPMPTKDLSNTWTR